MRKDKAIWLFAGGDMQEISARKIIELGYKLIITDMNPNCTCAKYADELIKMDTFDIKGNIKAVERLQKKYQIKAVFTAAADCHETVAHVGKLLKLHTISPKISHACRYKHISRKTLSDSGIPQPKFRNVGSLDEARIFIQGLGGQAVLKSTNNSGSRGFSVIKDIDELNHEVFERAVSAGTTGQVIVEETLHPVENEIAEQSIETVWYNGKMYWLNWVDRLFRKDFLFFDSLNTSIYSDIVWGVELGHINPAIHSYNTKKEIFDIVYRTGLAIGMNKEKGGHILKADIMLTPKGPYILEITPRLSGGWDSSGSTPARGADFIGGVINLSLGKKLDIDLWHNHFEYKNQNLFASVLAQIIPGAKDCIGRKFALGSDFQREQSIQNALNNLLEGKYVISVEQ
jgi:argininosuccinate lyase